MQSEGKNSQGKLRMRFLNLTLKGHKCASSIPHNPFWVNKGLKCSFFSVTEFLSNVTSTCHSSVFICRHSRAVDLSPMTWAINKQPTNYLHRNAPPTSSSFALCHSWTFPQALGCASVWLNKQHGAQKYIFLGISYPNILNL